MLFAFNAIVLNVMHCIILMNVFNLLAIAHSGPSSEKRHTQIIIKGNIADMKPCFWKMITYVQGEGDIINFWNIDVFCVLEINVQYPNNICSYRYLRVLGLYV